MTTNWTDTKGNNGCLKGKKLTDMNSSEYCVLSELTVEPEPEPVAEPEPAPVVERPLGSRGKVPVTTRTRSSQHTKVTKGFSTRQPQEYFQVVTITTS